MAEPPSRPHVLIVDDEENLRVSLGQILSLDYDVAVCASGREALALIEGGRRFEAILCDLMMPGMSGMDFYESLTALAPDQTARVVFLTGGAFTPRARDFLRAVSNPHLEKPFEVDELRAVVADAAARATGP